jgi:hypothetical protein
VLECSSSFALITWSFLPSPKLFCGLVTLAFKTEALWTAGEGHLDGIELMPG